MPGALVVQALARQAHKTSISREPRIEKLYLEIPVRGIPKCSRYSEAAQRSGECAIANRLRRIFAVAEDMRVPVAFEESYGVRPYNRHHVWRSFRAGRPVTLDNRRRSGVTSNVGCKA
jgi:hypothetical protein